jgi:DNA-binding transcriptional LysR family regulator
MDLNQIAIFVEVVDAGSFTNAAQTLNLPKATVSRKVAALEDSLGVRLLHRTTRSLTLTDAGDRYYRACRDNLSALTEANRLAAGEQEIPTGTIRVSGPADDTFLSHAAADFLALHKKVSIEVVLTDERLDLVGERIDVALRGGRLEDSSMMARNLMAGFSIVCASPGYLEAAPPLVTLADIKQHDCVIRGKSIHHASWLLEGPRGQEHVAVTGRIAVNSMAFALRASIAGLGLTLLPGGIAEPEFSTGRLKRVLPQWQTPSGGLFLVYPSHRHQSAAARAFIDFVVAKTSSPGWLLPQ